MRMLVVALLVSFLVGSAAHATSEADIRATFDRYRKAAVNKDGAAAALEVDAATAQYFGRIRSDALVAPDVHGLPILDKIFVLRARAELTADQLSAFDGRALVAHALTNGWIVTTQLGRASLSDIHVEGDRASALLIVAKVVAPDPFVFHREKARWHIDLTTFNAASGRALATLAASRHLSEDQLALRMLAEILGHPAPASVWSPVLPPRPR